MNLTITSDSALSFNQLNLNNLTLTLGSESSDLQVSSALILDNSSERVMTGAADFVSLASLDISDGGVISTGGIISILEEVSFPEQENWMLVEVLGVWVEIS